MEEKNVALVLSDAVKEQMEERGIREEDIRAVIASAESGGVKLRDDENGHFLGKKRLENYTVYVEYVASGDGFEVIETYGHKITMTSDI